MEPMHPYVQIFVTVFVFLFGISIGSFLNVVIYRVPAGKSIVSPPSSCPVCKNGIKWYDNIPILSYIILGAKCRHCKTPISIQYPMVELLTGTLAIAIFLRFGLSWSLLVYFVFVAMLIAITFIDIPYQIIPNEISIPGTVLGVGVSFFVPHIYWVDSVIGAVVGFSIIALIALGYWMLTKREGMGIGDAKLLAMIGAFLGWQSIPFVILVASIQGLIIALVSIGFGFMKKAPPLPDPEDWEDGKPPEMEEVALRHAAVPFGPFLALGALEFLFFGAMYYQYVTGLAG